MARLTIVFFTGALLDLGKFIVFGIYALLFIAGIAVTWNVIDRVAQKKDEKVLRRSSSSDIMLSNEVMELAK